MTQDLSSQRIHLPSVFFGVLGLLVSLYALIVHVQIMLKPGHGLLCDINSQFSCSAVLSSAYSEFASIPLGAYGMAYFMVVLAAAFLPKYAPITDKQLSYYELMISLSGFVVVTVLFSISYFVIKIFCPICVAIYGIVSLYTIFKVIDFFKLRQKQDVIPFSSETFLRFMAVSLCLGLPPLVAGLVAPMVITQFVPSAVTTGKGNKNPETRDVPTQNPLAIDTQKQLLTFNKTNYVGNGEDYRFGNDNAKVVIQMFSDFGCPHCKAASEALFKAQDLIGKDKVVFVYRFFPLSNECNPYVPSKGWYAYSCSLANMSRCAGQQNKFWEFKEWAFSGQEMSDQERAARFSTAGIKQELSQLGIQFDAFNQCVESGVELSKIKDDAAFANKLGIQGTPMIFINGIEYKGPHSVDDFVRAIQEAS